MILNFLFLSVILYRKLAGYPVGYLLKGLAKILVATALMSGGIWGLQRLLAPWMIGSTLVQIGALVVLIGVAVGIYVVGLQLLRLPEFTLLTGKLVQRFRRS
jgi:putative peptidoglycan lipid II flippase